MKIELSKQNSLIDSIYNQADQVLQQSDNCGIDFLLNTIDQDVETVARLAFKHSSFHWTIENKKISVQISPITPTSTVQGDLSFEQVVNDIESEIRSSRYEDYLDTKSLFVDEYLKLQVLQRKKLFKLPLEIRKIIGTFAGKREIPFLSGLFTKKETNEFRKELILQKGHPYKHHFFKYLKRSKPEEQEIFLNNHGDSYTHITEASGGPNSLTILSKKFPQLNELWLDPRDFTDETFNHIETLQNLQNLFNINIFAPTCSIPGKSLVDALEYGFTKHCLDVSALEKLPNVHYLRLCNFHVKNWDFLGTCPALIGLSINFMDTVENVDFLGKSQSLKVLSLSELTVHDLNGIAQLPKLTSCFLHNLPKITDIKPLEKCYKIEILSIDDLPNLKTVDPSLKLENLMDFRFNCLKRNKEGIPKKNNPKNRCCNIL